MKGRSSHSEAPANEEHDDKGSVAKWQHSFFILYKTISNTFLFRLLIIHGLHQYKTLCSVRNASACFPCNIASVLSIPACVHVSAATVIDAGASGTGHPVVGSRM